MSSSDWNNALMDTRQAIKPIYSDTSEKPPFRSTPVNQPFVRCLPEAAGVSSARIADFLCEIAEDETLNMHSILILKDGKMIAEAEFADQSTSVWKYTFSACKSIVSLAVGILCGMGRLSVGDRIVDLCSDRVNAVSRLRMSSLTG